MFEYGYGSNKSCSEIAKAKAIDVSHNYVVSTTGRQAKIFDRNMQLLHVVKNLQYVYRCIISPDETKILLISTGNWFYSVSLASFAVQKHIVSGYYSDNLEGRGCWTFDSRGCCLCVCSKDSVLSAIRFYDNIGDNQYREVLRDRFWLTSIQAVPSLKQYLLTGYKRDKNENYLIWYCEESTEEYLIHGLPMFDVAINAEYDEQTEECIIHGMDGSVVCTKDGRKIRPHLAEE